MNERPIVRFWWGVLLAWAPLVPTLIGFGYALRGISSTKATGLAALAGGVAEMLVLWGFATMLISQIVAIVWLWRRFSRNNIFRNLVGAASLCMSGLTFLLLAFFLWSTRL
jgi:hypothetical protein